MEDDKLKSLFCDYQPRLTSDKDFMASLGKQLMTVDLVKSQLKNRQRSRRIAAVAAVATGFVMGVISTLCYPILADFIHSAAMSSSAMTANLIETYGNISIWIPICVITMAASYVAYDITFLTTANQNSFDRQHQLIP